MSEYWVSKKKYWCQYCEIFIADDAPSRAQHENGLRHKGSKDRYIRGLYKTGIKRKQDGEEEKREMKRIEAAAEAAYAQDVSTGLARASSSSSSSAAVAATPQPKPTALKPSDPYANYTTAASLGISDPDVDSLIAEADKRRTEGVAGDWVPVVPPPPPPLPPPSGDSTSSDVKVEVKAEDGTGLDAAAAGQVRKRVEAEPTDEYDPRHFKLRKRMAAVGLGEIYDPGIIRVKPRTEPAAVKPETPEIVAAPIQQQRPSGPALGGDALESSSSSQPLPAATAKPTWVSRGWKRAGEESITGEEDASKAASSPLTAQSQAIPATESTLQQQEEDIKTDDIKNEPVDTPSLPPASNIEVVFRKRKIPTNSGARRRDM